MKSLPHASSSPRAHTHLPEAMAVPTNRSPASRRRGAALMIVLGLLSVLLITAVTFSILMRLERAGSSNFRHGATARHMLQSGLAHAIEDIHIEAAQDLYPLFNRAIPANPPFADHVLPSYVADGGIDARILSVEAMEFVPYIFRDAVRNATPHWIPIHAGSGTDRRLVGRVAYIIINTSGLLDANIAGRTNRWMGASAEEIQLRPELLTDITDMDDFTTTRTADVRYETVPEFRRLNDGIDRERMSHFGIYARTPVVDLNPDGDPKVYIGGNRAALEAQGPQIIEAFRRSGLSDNHENAPWSYGNLAERAYLGLLDYVDGSTPNLAAPTTAPVPMVQTFAFALRVEKSENPDVDGNFTWTCRYDFRADITYPFVAVTGFPNFDGVLDISINDLGTGETYKPLLPLFPENNASHNPPGFTVSPNSFFEVHLESSAPGCTTILKLPPGESPSLRFDVELRAQVKRGTTIVDSVPAPYDRPGIRFTISEVLDGGQTFEFWAETIDPRFNWNPGEFWQWMDNSVLELYANEVPNYVPRYIPGGENSLVSFLFANPQVVADPSKAFGTPFDGMRMGSNGADDPRQQFWMYSANRPLQSLGELGFLPIAPWTTIALYDKEHAEAWGLIPPDPGFHRVLDYFTLDDPDNPASHPRRVNINTQIPNILESVYVDMPVREWSGTDIFRVNNVGSRLGTFADHFRSMQPFTQLSDIGKVWRDISNLQSAGGPLKLFDGIGTGISEFDREAVIRNAINLFSIRDQHFTIILRADAFVPSFGHTGIEQGSVLATGHAVAEIWRDALPRVIGQDSSGNDIRHHPTQLRLFMPIGR